MLLLGLLAAATGVVVLEQPSDPELLRRVLGQVGDLNRTIEVEARTSTATDPMVRARQLVRGREAEAVIWIDASEGSFSVTVVHLASGRPVAREVAPVRDRADRIASATKEAAALVVRSTLQAMETWREREAEAPPIEEAPPPETPPVVPIDPRSSLGFEAALGWIAAANGGGFGPHGPELRIALRGSIWSIGIELATDLPERSADEIATVELVRYRAGATGALDLFEVGPLVFGPAISVGSSIHRRSTVSTASGVIATPPSTTVALAVGAEARITYRFELSAGTIGVELAGGAHGLFGAPEIAYRREEETIERARPWPVQPYARLGLVFRSREAVTRSEDGAPL